MNLVIDRGNTQIKFGIFDQGRLLHTDYANFLDKRILSDLTQQFDITKAILSSVVEADNEKLVELLQDNVRYVMQLSSDTPLPFQWTYETKATIGKDRLAAVAGGIALYPKTNLLIIDAGTAITYEILTEEQVYLGGNIAPGLQMRFKALNSFTSKLPLLEPAEDAPLIGNSTKEAICAGVQYGMIFEIDGLIERLSDTYLNLTTIITGGDAEFFARKLKNPIFVHPNLVLIGLNRILENNA